MTTYDALAKRVIGLQTEYRPLLEQRRRQAEQAFEEEEIGPSAEELHDLYQRFLALDEAKMPTFEQGARQVKKAHVIYTLSQINYRSMRASIARHIQWWGESRLAGEADHMLMWLDEYEERASHAEHELSQQAGE